MFEWLTSLIGKRRRDTTKLRGEAEREHMHRKCRELAAQSQLSMTRTRIRRALEEETCPPPAKQG